MLKPRQSVPTVNSATRVWAAVPQIEGPELSSTRHHLSTPCPLLLLFFPQLLFCWDKIIRSAVERCARRRRKLWLCWPPAAVVEYWNAESWKNKSFRSTRSPLYPTPSSSLLAIFPPCVASHVDRILPLSGSSNSMGRILHSVPIKVNIGLLLSRDKSGNPNY